MRIISNLFIFCFILLSLSAHADKYADTIEIFTASDSAKSFLANAYGYAVFPTIGKVGFGIGGAGGGGQVYRGDKVTGTTSMGQLSIGFQAGGQAYSQIIFFEDKRAYEEFTSGNFEFGAGATAVAITASASAQSGTTGNAAGTGNGNTNKSIATYNKGLAVMTHVKGGLMYEAALAGQKYGFEPLEAEKK